MDDAIIDKGIDNLEHKAVNSAKLHIALSAQGYVVNSLKKEKLSWISILIHAFDQLPIMTEQQQNNIVLLYNKVFNV